MGEVQPKRRQRRGVRLALAFALAALAAQARASNEAAREWDVSVAAAREVSAMEGRSEAGRRYYDVCVSCHLVGGAGDEGGTMPRIGGQHRSVLIKQLLDIRSGRRRNPVMAPYMEALPDLQAIADVATHLAALPVPPSVGRGPGTETARGARLYRERCASCHGARGEGVAETFSPALQGQHYRYLVRQLIDIAGVRRDNAFPAMVEAVSDLSARDVSSIADFVSRLPATASDRGGEAR